MPSSNIEKQVINLIRARGKLGRKKYRATMDRRDLKPSDWIQHFQEEMCDGLQYAERMKAIALLTESAAQILGTLADNLAIFAHKRTRITEIHGADMDEILQRSILP